MPLAAWQILDQGPTRLSAGAVGLEKDLETWIAADAGLLDRGLLVVQRQMHVAGGILDLLCVDPQGRATVVEIKRGKLIRETIAQAIDYASSVASLSLDTLRAKIVEHLGPDAIAKPAIAALLDGSDAEGREVAIIVVGVGQDPAIERMIDYLGSGIGMAIRAVTFDVFEFGDGQRILVREETEAEPSLVADVLPTNNRDAVIARAGGPASPNGRRMREIAEAGERNGLFVRPYKRSLMLTPPENKTRFLMNMWTWSNKPDELVVSYGADAFAEFFPVEATAVTQIFGPEASAVPIRSDDDAQRWVRGLDHLFELIRGEVGHVLDAAPLHATSEAREEPE